jgi:hypothetical protein
MTSLLIGASDVVTSEQQIQVAHFKIKVSSPAARYLTQFTASVIICSMKNPSSKNGFEEFARGFTACGDALVQSTYIRVMKEVPKVTIRRIRHASNSHKRRE